MSDKKVYTRACPSCGKVKTYESRSNYNRAVKNNTVCRSCWFKSRQKYTNEEIIEESRKYRYPIEFVKGNKKMYDVAVNRGILDRLEYKEGYIGDIKHRLVYVYEFLDMSVYVGLTYNFEKRKLEHSSGGTSVSKHIVKTGLIPSVKVLSDNYISGDDARILEQELISEYKKEGWNILNVRPGGDLGGNNIKWTDDKIIKILKNNKYINDVYNELPYCAIKRGRDCGLFDKYGKHLISLSRTFENDDEIISLCKQYNTKKELRLNDRSLYHVVLQRNLQDRAFSHMVSAKGDVIKDKNTGELYYGYKDAVNRLNLDIGARTLYAQLTGSRTNNHPHLVVIEKVRKNTK